MRALHSIRWRLQIWYGAILVMVLAGFGVTAYQLERGRQLRRVDDGLQRRASQIMAALHRPFPRPGPEDAGPDAGPRPPPPLDAPGETGLPPPPRIRLPRDMTNALSGEEEAAMYFIAWAPDDRELARSTNAPPDAPRPERSEFVSPSPPRIRGDLREVVHVTPPGEIVLVGRSIAGELGDLRHAALSLCAVGGAVLLIGLLGGWWIATRAMRPVDQISATAAGIASGDLSQRVNIAEADSELGRLASVLNSTFARLEAAFTQQRQFASDAAHELRTPVAVMLTQTQSALGRERSLGEYRETIESCQRAAQRMRRLLETLLELTRLDAGQETMKRARFDFSKMVNECVTLVRPLANERGVRIFAELPELDCHGDSERLAQVVTNLLINAIQYNRAGGEARVSAQSLGGALVLSVADTGQGIGEADLPRVFERFYRADASRSAGQAGLGLAISKAIVEAHGGTIDVASRAGHGAVFTVRLPQIES